MYGFAVDLESHALARRLRRPVDPVCAQQQPAVAAGAGVAGRRADRALMSSDVEVVSRTGTNGFHHCLQTGQLYNEHRAFPPPPALAA
jgi:hypothetical protein